MISILGQPLWPWKLFTHSSVLIICRGRRCDWGVYFADQGCSCRCTGIEEGSSQHLLSHQRPSLPSKLQFTPTAPKSRQHPILFPTLKCNFRASGRTPLPSNPSVHPTSNFEVGSSVDDSPKLDSPPKLNSFLVRLTRHFSIRPIHPESNSLCPKVLQLP